MADKQGENGAVAILDVGEEFSLVSNYALPDEVRSVDWNSASDRFCCAAGMVLFLFEFSGNRLTLLKQVNSSESEDVREVEFDPTGRVLASAGEDGSLRLWDARDLQHLDTILTTDEWVTGIGFNPRDSQLAATTSDGKIRMWDIDLQTASATPVKIGNGFDFHRGAVLISGWCVLRCIILIVRRQRKRFSLEV
mgnify:FL=1